MEEKTCESCLHYRQHYVKAGEEYTSIHYGHCVYPRRKRREAAAPACPHYKEKAEDPAE